jgi:acyl-CoA reductase-like NAD-dependent aldehyde dehydrogenase
MKHLSLIGIILLLTVASVWAVDDPSTAQTPVTIAPTTKTATIDATDKPVVDVIKDIAQETGETILVESLVDGKITAKAKDVPVDKALDIATKAAKLHWRKIYVLPGTILAKDADALASQMRTVLALKFPDMIISPLGSGGSFLHVQKENSADEITKILPATAGFKAVYLVTDDVKAYKKEIKEESKKKIKGYVDAQKKLMEDFLAMSPEERKAVLAESMNLMNQLGTEGMKAMMDSVFQLDPEYFGEMNKMSMQVIMGMDQDSRRKLLSMSIKQQADMMNSMTPEQQQQFQQDIQAIISDMSGQATSGGQ